MPPTVGFRPYRTQVLGNYWPEFKNPPTDRFIADHQFALSQKIFDIPIAQREPEVDRGDGSMKASGDGAQCVTGGNTSGNLFTLAEAQYSRCTTALRGRNTP